MKILITKTEYGTVDIEDVTDMAEGLEIARNQIDDSEVDWNPEVDYSYMVVSNGEE